MRNNKIKVLLCAPYNGTIGGIVRWTQHIMKYNANYPNENIDLLLYDINRKREIYSNDSKIKRIITGIIEYWSIIKKFKTKISSDDFNVVHFTSSASFGLLRDVIMLKYARKNKLKSIIHFRFGRIPDLYKSKNWEQKLLHRVIINSDKIIVIDEASYKTLMEEGYNNIELLPNPLSPEIINIIQANKGIKRQDRKIIFAGHVVETKGIFELIEVCKKIPNTNLKLIGAVSDEMKQNILKLAGRDCSQWLDIAGEFKYEDTIKEMLSAGVFVLPTYTEGFPNVILESMACACPIVTSSVGAIPEMLDVDSDTTYGICIEPKNIDQLRDGIIKMLDDRTFAINCGLNAQKRVNEQYSMPIIWKRLIDIWINTAK
jgi:glycosyltransferase involved in cell wall biosynthesis